MTHTIARPVTSHARAHGLPAIDRAIGDLRLLGAYWPGLVATRLPDVVRPYQPPTITPEQRAELDYEARLERAERVGEAPGEHIDAARPDVLDLLFELIDTAEDLAAHVSRAAWLPVLPPPAGVLADARPFLERTARYLPAAAVGWANGDELVWWVARTARQMLVQAGRALALTHDGQRLDAVCPWCQGRTETAPVGGAKTWRVRDLLAAQRCEHDQIERLTCVRCPQLIAIVCESGTCEPPSKDVGTWWRGRPAWPIEEWDWLARRLVAAEAHTTRSVTWTSSSSSTP
ncbi:hypothetical protein [Spirillospora sp. CA-128828]|uniref:hypothetical protein n=1 Tax=Spirillospora sp. CA-128828 TaxID=3240033 RepID=UPI003D8C4847